MTTPAPGSKPRRRKKSAPRIANPHVAKANAYRDGVLAGAIAACKWVRLACQRQKDDLARAGTAAFPYRFDEDLAGRACEFFELMPHTQGPLSFVRSDGSWNTLTLEPWQCFVVTTIYGWVRTDTGGRRFQRAYEEIPRGNGKSFKLSGALLYSFTEGEQGVEAYSAAVDREQASKVYGEAEAMLHRRPDLSAELGLEAFSHAIVQRATNSKAKALSREARRTGDGKNVYFCAIDELHQHPTREVWDVIDTGTGKRAPSNGRGPLVWIITTSGFNQSGICYDRRAYVRSILEGTVKDEAWFGIIYTIDDTDDWTDEECRSACHDHSHPGCVWRKANPNWGVSVDPIDFEAKARAAIQVTSAQVNFLTKHLNVWCNSGRQWIDPKAWDRCADPNLSPDQFEDADGVECVVGADLATKRDMTAKARLFFRDEEREGATRRHYYLFVDCYLPEAAVEESRNSQYVGWAREGRIKVTPGDTIDFDVLREEFLEDARRFRPLAFPWDPWNATQLMTELQAEGLPVVDLAPNVKNVSPAMKEFDGLVADGLIHHDGNPVMRWMLSNVVVKEDAKGNLYPRKEAPENKIDGVMAALSALARALLVEPTPDLSHGFDWI